MTSTETTDTSRNDAASPNTIAPRPRGRALPVAMFIFAASPAIIPLWIIERFGVDIPYWDQWDTPGASMLALLSGKLTLAHLIAQHREHRMLIPRLFWLSVDYLSHWNVLDDLRLSWLVMCGTSLAVLVLIRRMRIVESARMGAILWPWFFCNLLIFHPRQWDNFLSGIGLSNLLPMLFIPLALVVASARMSLRSRVMMAMPLCFATQFSMGAGILAWLLIGIVLFWQPTWARFVQNKWLMMSWTMMAAVSSAWYFHGFVRPADGPHAFDLARSTEFGLIVLGSILSWPQSFIDQPFLAECFGGELLLMFVPAAAYFFYAWLRRRDEEFCRRMLIWLTIGIYAIICAVLGASVRQGFAEPMTSRYISFSLYLPLALVWLLPAVWRDARQHRAKSRAANVRVDSLPATAFITFKRHLVNHQQFLPATFGVALTLFLAASMPQAMDEVAQAHRTRTQAKAAILLFDILPRSTAAAFAFPQPQMLTAKVHAFDRAGFFRPPVMQSTIVTTSDILPQSPLGELEHLSIVGDTLVLTGWAHPAPGAEVDSVVITYQDAEGTPIICAQAVYGTLRTDIAGRFHDVDFKSSGFVASMPRDVIPKDLGATVLHAWTMDVNTCKFHRIAGELRIPQ